ncbi:hypothetical protein HRbin01_00757 [archaeon HR01]|nr:hypothetical protein HRbin01_00757 [archaeon HR01]
MSFMDTVRKRAEIVRSWREHVYGVAKAVKELLPDAEIYVFGSAVAGDLIASSDIDILVVSEKIPGGLFEIGRVKVEIEKKAGLPYYHPFEFHLVKPGESEEYLRRAGKHILRIC